MSQRERERERESKIENHSAYPMHIKREFQNTDIQEKLKAKLCDKVRRRQTRIGTWDLHGSTA